MFRIYFSILIVPGIRVRACSQNNFILYSTGIIVFFLHFLICGHLHFIYVVINKIVRIRNMFDKRLPSVKVEKFLFRHTLQSEWPIIVKHSKMSRTHISRTFRQLHLKMSAVTAAAARTYLRIEQNIFTIYFIFRN